MIQSNRSTKYIKLFENYEYENLSFRGTNIKESTLAATIGHLPYYSDDAMPDDPEVLKRCIDGYNNMSRDEQDEEIASIVRWKGMKGVNLTNDADNAAGYGDCVIAVDTQCPIGDFGYGYIFAKNPEGCLVKAIRWQRTWYTPKDFLALGLL